MSSKSKISSSESRSHQLKLQNLSQVPVQMRLLDVPQQVQRPGHTSPPPAGLGGRGDRFTARPRPAHAVGRRGIMVTDIPSQTGGNESRKEPWVHNAFEIKPGKCFASLDSVSRPGRILRNFCLFLLGTQLPNSCLPSFL